MLLKRDGNKVIITPASGGVHGKLFVPGDKSISHRSIMIGALSEGETKISGFLKSADCISTINCFKALGVDIDENDGVISVSGLGPQGLKKPGHPLDVGNSGTTMRLLSGILAAQDFECEITGDASIMKRPMKRVMEPLSAMGADIASLGGDGLAPLKIKGSILHGTGWVSKVASAQVKSCVLLAGLCSGVPVSVTEPALSRDHTERMLRAFGVGVDTVIRPDKSATVSIGAGCTLKSPGNIAVPGDISSAAYFLAAGAMIPGSSVTVENTGINPTRDGIIKVLEMIGADPVFENAKEDSEPSADIVVTHPGIERIREHYQNEIVIGAPLIPTLIDELPVIAAMACVMPGRTIIKDARELRVKESDRIEAMTAELSKMGARIQGTPDGFIIDGVEKLHGAAVDSHSDHRVAMSLATAALCAEGETVIDGADCVDISYPAFFEDLQKLI
ncbi:MAG: 3-phosphoshikimate 1-carboxyvinyltransferase [Lachnospiraceae bacterium]|nr:3-phosphoshikimate 1-carboxyvinyltransferase [Lachnospiraceae bacterium]